MAYYSLTISGQQVNLSLPDHTDSLTLPEDPALTNPAQAIRAILENPVGTPALADLAHGKQSAVIVVSDNTRPVPYAGENGLLKPLLEILKSQQVTDIKILIATGTHREMSETELRTMLGDAAFAPSVQIINHVCTDNDMLRCIGSTSNTPEVTINRHYLDADLKILTGLVEPHFMAGYSGGRKAVCPGISGQSVTYGFHSAAMLDDAQATSLVLEGNPCHEESLTIARMAGVDFIVNATVNRHHQLTGVFAGELELAHREAVDYCRNAATVSYDKPYDIVITHSGHVGINHYQCGKAAVEAGRAVKPGGHIILLADLTDTDPIGSERYRKSLKQLASLGPAEYRKGILSRDWDFIPEQWGAQMWTKVHLHLGDPRHLMLCAPQLTTPQDDLLLDTNVAASCGNITPESLDKWQTMVSWCLEQLQPQRDSRVLVLPDGPYAVPVLGSSRAERVT